MIDKIIALCKRRGFVYPSSEIYGGLANSWDFGHYGTLLKNNLRDLWWKQFVLDRDDMVALDASIFLNPRVWEASGHVAGFTDALTECRNCHRRTRADHLIEDAVKGIKVEGLSPDELTRLIKTHNLTCPYCHKEDFTEVRRFNLLFETKLGIVEDRQSTIYLRGEIAQGLFTNFKNVLDTMRVKIPFGMAQYGKAFRNEITMGQFVHRTLEFDLAEFEYFIHPNQWEEVYEYWKGQLWNFIIRAGIDEAHLRFREHESHERSHYSKRTIDVEYQYPFGFKELAGIAYRTEFDLTNHMNASGVDLEVTDQKTGKQFIPHVIEPTVGISRLTGALLFDAYREEKIEGKTRVFLKLHPRVAPIKAAIFPLQKDEKLYSRARDIYVLLKKQYVVEFDNSGNIGKMYRRQDEIGTPLCVTIDYKTLEDQTVTIRERDSMRQERVAGHNLVDYIRNIISL